MPVIVPKQQTLFTFSSDYYNILKQEPPAGKEY